MILFWQENGNGLREPDISTASSSHRDTGETKESSTSHIRHNRSSSANDKEPRVVKSRSCLQDGEIEHQGGGHQGGLWATAPLSTSGLAEAPEKLKRKAEGNLFRLWNEGVQGWHSAELSRTFAWFNDLCWECGQWSWKVCKTSGHRVRDWCHRSGTTLSISKWYQCWYVISNFLKWTIKTLPCFSSQFCLSLAFFSC